MESVSTVRAVATAVNLLVRIIEISSDELAIVRFLQYDNRFQGSVT